MTSTPPSSPHKKWLSFTIKFAVSAALVWFLLDKAGVSEAMQRLGAVSVPHVFLSALVALVQVGFAGLRWRAVLRAIDAVLGYWKLVQLLLIGIFFSQVLPSSVGGDAVRIYKCHKSGLKLSAAINGVMLERLVTVVALIVLVLAMQPWFLERVDPANAALLLWGLALAAAALLAGLVFLMMLDRLPEGYRRYRLVRAVGYLAADTRRLFLVPRALVPAMAWAVIGHANIALAVWILALGLRLDVTFIDCLTLIPLVILATTVPISIAGWGVREGAMVAAFGFVGVPADAALALSLLFGLLGLAVALPGGVIWALTRDAGEQTASEAELLEAQPPGRQ